jgi:hypothetical protein
MCYKATIIFIWLSIWCSIVHHAALTPLAEFNDSALSKKYEIKPSPEVIKIATTAAEQKKVRFQFDHHEVIIRSLFYLYIFIHFIIVTDILCGIGYGACKDLLGRCW